MSRLQKSELIPMKEAAQRLRKAAANLEERVRFNQSSLSDAIEMLIGQAESAQLFLENKGPEQLSKVIKRTSLKKRLKFSSVGGRRR